MRFRWTIKDLDNSSDTRVLRSLVAERMSRMNPYTPLARRLQKIYDKLTKNLESFEMRRRAQLR